MTYHIRLAKVDDRVGLLFMASVFCVTAICSVTLRFYARRLKNVDLGIDDWLAFASMIFVLGLNAIFIGGTAQGAITGHSPVVDDWPVSTNLEHLVQKYKFGFQTTEKIAFGLIKLSILFLWMRIFAAVRGFRIFCWVMIFVVLAWSAAFFFATLFQCGTHWTWNWAPILFFLTRCTNTLAMLTVFTATDVLTDFIIMFMPVSTIWKLHMPTRKKVGITTLFMVGLFTIGAGVARMYIYLTTSYDKEDNPDFIADFTMFILWSEIEVNVAMIVCCMPTFIPIISKARDLGYRFSESTGIRKWSILSAGSSNAKLDKRDAESGKSASVTSVDPRHHIWVGAGKSTGTETMATQATAGDDIEAELHRYGGIMAHTEIVNVVESCH